MPTNIEITAELNKLLQQQNQLYLVQAKLMRGQLLMAQQLADTMKQVKPSEISDELDTLESSVRKASGTISEFGSNTQANFGRIKAHLGGSGKSALDLNGKLKTLNKGFLTFAIAASALNDIESGFRIVGNAATSSFNILSSVFGLLTSISISVITAPFKMLGILISQVQQGSTELLQAIEDVRKAFGDLHKGSSAAILGMWKSMHGRLAETGLSVYRIFGNLAERLKTLTEYATQLGPMFTNLSDGLLRNAEAFGAYVKGLGLSEDGLKGVGRQALISGKTFTEVSREITGMTYQMGAAFGINGKEISRAVGDMLNDVKNFGSLGVKTLTQIAVFTRKLGLEFKDLQGVIDKFDNFEDAAVSAAKLSQAFGLNVDAVELLREQDPAARFEKLRRAFFQTGKSVEEMTRQELELLASETGLSHEAVKLGFSIKNQGVSYNDIQKKAELTTKKQLTQAEAMQKLANSIERLVKQGELLNKGFFEQFLRGFAKGIAWSKDFRLVMINLRQALWTVHRAGITVGRYFVKEFPGVSQVFKGLQQVFDRRKWQALMHDVIEVFRKFFKDVQTDPRGGLKTLLDKIKNVFFNFFDSKKSAGMNIIKGFRTFFKTVITIAGEVLRTGISAITDAIRIITQIIINPKKALAAGGGGASGIGGGLVGLIKELFGKAALAIWEVMPALYDALKKLFSAILDKLKPYFYRYLPYIMGIIFGPSIIKLAIGTGTSILATIFSSMITNSLKQGVLKKATDKAAEFFVSKISGVVPVAQTSNIPATASQATSAIRAAEGPSAAAARSSISLASIGKMALIATVITVGIIGIMAAIVKTAQYVKKNKISPADIITASIAFGAAAAIVGIIATATVGISLASKVIASSAKDVLIGMLVIGGVGAAMALGAYALVETLGKLKPAELKRTGIIMLATGAFFTVAAGVAVIAAGLGLIASAGGGLGALTIAAGLLTISATIELMSSQAAKLIATVGNLRIPTGFKEKFTIFIQALEAIGSFSANIGQISQATSSNSFISYLTGHGGDQIKSLRLIKDTMKLMGTQLIQIVQQVVQQTNVLKGGPSDLKKAEIFASLLTGVVSIAEAIKPPMETFETSSFDFFAIGAVNKATAGMAQMRTTFVALSRIIPLLVNSATQFIEQTPFISDAQIKTLEITFSSIGNILQTFRTITVSVLPTSLLSSISASDLRKKKDMIKGIITSILQGFFSPGSGVINFVSNFITATVKAINQINLTDTQIKRVSAIAPIIEGSFKAISSIAEAVGSVGQIVVLSRPEDISRNIGTLRQFMDTFFNQIGGLFTNVIDTVSRSFAGKTTKELGVLSKGVEVIRTSIEAISSIVDIAKNLHESLKSSAGSGEYGRIRQQLGTMVGLFTDAGTGQPGIPTLINSVVKAITEISSGVNVGEIDTTGLKSLENSVKQITDRYATGIISTLNNFVTKVNETTDDLGSLSKSPLRISAVMTRLSENLSVSTAKGRPLTIKNRSFNINVNLEVKLDVEDIEKVLYHRVTKNGLNFSHAPEGIGGD